MNFVHLHLHTQYSVLDGLTNTKKLFKRCRELGMSAVAITDHGNMYGVKEFMKWAFDKKSNIGEDGKPLVKPIIGCEVYVTRHYDHKLGDASHRKYYHLILLAKNYEGYRNLMKIVSLGHIEGMYYKPRVDHEIIEKYHENLICTSACLAGEIATNIREGNMEAARKAALWHKNLFGEDYYLEVMKHKTEIPGLDQDVYREQLVANEGIFQLAQELGIKTVATNDVHFLTKEDGPVHDRLICLTTNANISDPDRLRYTQQEYLKTRQEMEELFPDHPESLDATLEIADKVELYSIDRPHVLPKFELPEDFLADAPAQLEKYASVIDQGRTDKDGADRGQDFCLSVAYLCHLTYEGARRRYGQTLSETQAERIDFELKTICKMGFPDYFLIVQDYIGASRKMGYLVGPGRGSAAGSVVAYCLNITNLDPLKYDLLFERFLNPDRISMPDIDVDFENIPAAHRYVEQKYGKDHVSRVITFGTMAAKSSIKDIARISQQTIPESNRLAAMVPDRLSEKKEKEYPYDPKFDEPKKGFKVVQREVETDDPQNPGQKITVTKSFQVGLEDTDVTVNLENCFRLVPDFREELENGTELNREILHYAGKLEGSIRQTGQHACATIIGRGNLTDYIPICLSKDKETGEDVWTSQYDGHYIEDVGMLKMDFLGLNTLSIIHTTLDNIKERHGKDIDIEAIPIDDRQTYEMYGRGDTMAVFQFESEGMKNHLQHLHPSRFEDLIAMNALYRPGPMDYIPDFIDRKMGVKPIEYDLPEMEEFLSSTYGITVYQEQVMQLSQKLAGFTKGQADTLRKAMGKKQIDTLNSLKGKFMEGGVRNGHPDKVLDKIWKDWEKFAQYAFNKSHATCYAWVSYQTGWLKTHYTAEFLAANLSCNLSNMDEIKKIMADCKMHRIKVLNPDVNESSAAFTVNSEGNIRFGLAGVKGFGSNIVEAIISERKRGGLFRDYYDFLERMAEVSKKDPKTSVNRKSLESLIYSGGFDSFDPRRELFFSPCANGELFIDELARYADGLKNDTMDAGASLFGEVEELKPQRPEPPETIVHIDPLTLLLKEKELVGMYLSTHPLDRYGFEMKNFTNCSLPRIGSVIAQCTEDGKPRALRLGGIVTEVNEFKTRSGRDAVKALVEDYDGVYEFAFFGKDVDKFLPYMKVHEELFIDAEVKQMRFNKQDEGEADRPAEFKLFVKDMMKLGNVNEQFLKSIEVVVDTALVCKDLTDSLVKLFKANKGSTKLEITLKDPKWGVIPFTSHRFSLNATSALVDSLTALGLSYKISSSLK